MTTTEIRERLAIAAATDTVVTVRLKGGDVLTGVPAGAGRPRWFQIDGRTVHQYEIDTVKEAEVPAPEVFASATN